MSNTTIKAGIRKNCKYCGTEMTEAPPQNTDPWTMTLTCPHCFAQLLANGNAANIWKTPLTDSPAQGS